MNGQVPPWAKAQANAWSQADNAVVLSDMGACAPAGAISTDCEPAKWKLIPYEAGDVTGRLGWSPGGAGAPPLTLRLGAAGWHAVFVGLYTTRLAPCLAWMHLDGDPAPLPVAPVEPTSTAVAGSMS